MCVGVFPPATTPRIGDEVAPGYVVTAAKEPKFVELPLVAIVIESIVLIRVGAVFPVSYTHLRAHETLR